MTNRWRQSLYNQINEKQNQLEEKQHREELNHEIVMAQERLEELEEELAETPLLNSEEEFNQFEEKIEAVEVEK